MLTALLHRGRRGLEPGMLGDGKPQRIITCSRTPPGAVRTIGAILLGDTRPRRPHHQPANAC
jgi:hypothetical protein